MTNSISYRGPSRVITSVEPKIQTTLRSAPNFLAFKQIKSSPTIAARSFAAPRFRNPLALRSSVGPPVEHYIEQDYSSDPSPLPTYKVEDQQEPKDEENSLRPWHTGR